MAETPTDRLGLSTYEQGDDEWDHTDTVLWIDEHGTAHGTLAGRPDTGTYHGQRYHALDVDITFYWDDNAASWGYQGGFGDENNRINRTMYLATLNANNINGVDASQLEGDAGTAGQILQTDGSAASWVDSSSAANTLDHLSVTSWDVIDVGNHGFPGDQTGGDLAQFIADQTDAGGQYVFVLPRGTYNWQRPLFFTGGTGTYDEPMPEKLAIIGKPEATLYADMPTDSERYYFRFGGSSNGFEDVRVKNIHFDVGNQSDARDAGITRSYIADYALFENLTLSARKRLQSDGTINGGRFCLAVDCINPDATAEMRRVRLPNGDVFQGADLSVGHAIPFASEDPHVGTNVWQDCYVEGFTDNGYYLRDGWGSNYVLNCQAKDCAAGQFRLGRNDYAENIKAEVTSACPYNSTPLWIQEHRDVSDQSTYTPGAEDDSPVVVQGFELLAEGSDTNDIIRITSNPPEVRLEGGYIRNREDEYLIDATHYTGKVSVNDLTVDDHATGNTRLAAINIDGPNVQFDNLTYRAHPPTGENGRSLFWLKDECKRCIVKDSDLQSSYYPLVEAEAGSELTIVDTPTENTSSSPYLVRLQSTPMAYLNLRNNDFSDYTGLNADLANITEHHIEDNRGLQDGDVLASGTATLSSGVATVDTGQASPKIDVQLDPSGGGANASDVKVSWRAFFDSAAGTVKVEIVEDGTSVGSFDVGYEIVAA